jgi:hypothetical protein
MAHVVNLNKFRKRKAKLEKEKQAETNRRLHGRTKAERLLELKQKQLLDAKVDGARLSQSPAAIDDHGAAGDADADAGDDADE